MTAQALPAPALGSARAGGQEPFGAWTRFLRSDGFKASFAALACLLILITRAPDVFTMPQFWAEDGSVFFRGAMVDGVASILHPYAGYLHLVPRLVALAAARFSAGDAPAIYAYGAVAITLWCSACIAGSRAPAALALAVAIVAVPGSHEVFGSITNIQWFMQTALLVIVASPGSPGRASAWNRAAFAVLASLSGPFSILLSPVSLCGLCFRRAWRRSAHQQMIDAVVLVAAAVQLCVLFAFGDDQATTSYRPAHLFQIMLSQSLDPGLPTTTSHMTCAPLRLALAVLAVAAAQARQRRFVWALGVYVVADFAATWVRALHNGDNIFHGFGDRYFYFPRLFIIWCACIAVCHRPFLPVSRGAVFGGLTILLMFGGPSAWRRPGLHALPWRPLAGRIDAGQAVTIVINPSTEATPIESRWRVEMPARP